MHFKIFSINIIGILSILISTNMYAESNQLVEVYNEMLIVEATQFGHGSGIDSSGENKYVFPISLGMENRKIKNDTLYLIGTNLENNKIHYRSSSAKLTNYRNNSIAIFTRKNNENEKYKLISTNNKRELDSNFYKAKYVKDEKIKHLVNGFVLSEFKERYGFTLNNTTLRICNNSPSEVYQVFKKSNDKIYYYSANCTNWGGESYSGKSITALFRKDENGKSLLLWKALFSDDWEWAGGNPYVTYYVGDLDNDGNIEVFLSKGQGLSSTTYLAEIQNNRVDVIYEVKFNSEGESASYPTSRNDKLLFNE